MTQPARASNSVLSVGLQMDFDCTISGAVVSQFASLSGDFNPLHTDEAFAVKYGMKGKVAHGGIQQALLSRLVGMHLPIQNVALTGVATDYIEPVLEGETLHVLGEMTQWNESAGTGMLKATITSNGRLKSISTVKFMCLAHSPSLNHKPLRISVPKQDTAPTVLMVAGSSQLAIQTKECLNARGLSVVTAGRKHCDWNLDLTALQDSDWIRQIQNASISSVIFFGSLPPLKQALTELDWNLLWENIILHTHPVQLLSRAIIKGTVTSVRSIVMLGSAGARHLFPEKGYEGYAYAKMVASYFCRDLARELAPHGAAIHVIAPSEMGIGMTGQLPNKLKTLLKSQIPTGNFVSPSDIASILELIVKEDTRALSGQEWVLSGGRIR